MPRLQRRVPGIFPALPINNPGSYIMMRLLTLFISAISLPLVACTSAQDGGTSSAAAASSAGAAASGPAELIGAESGVAAIVNGEKITFAEVDEAAAAQLTRLKTQAYDLRKQNLDKLIDDRLIAAEAAKRGVSSEDLLKAEVNDKLAEVSDEEAKAYFDKNPPRGQVDFEKIKPRVKAYLQRKNETDLRAAFIASLRSQAGVEVMLQPMRFDVSFDKDDPIYGSPDAPVVIVEFSDFQCPYCSRVNPTLEQVKTTYGDKVALVFRDFPLPMHKEAPQAGAAAQCANDQGKFWEYHDKLFANQRALEDDKLKGYAAELGLDSAAFDSCLESGKYLAEVEEDKKAGAAVGVAGTPAFFINGQFLNGARPFESFKELIDSELKAKGLL
tara:strand:+ start:2056 stop:3213 length:1158 start_codon:yes stop_codon:yes gene_type:complete